MVRNFIIVAFRQLLKNKTYSIINIGGLGIGLACCIAIGLYIQDELSYDRFHPNQNVYRVTEMQEQAGDLYPVAVTPGLLARELKNDFPAIEQACRIGTVWRSPVFQSEGRSIEPGALLVVDNSLFTMFHFPLLYGDPRTALSGANDVVLTERTAVSLFGAEWRSKNVLGKEVKFNNDRLLTIVAIAENPPDNSHIQFNGLLSMKYDEATSDNFAWNSNNYHTYISLVPATDLTSFKGSIFHYLNKFDKERKITLDLQHLHDIHLHSDFAFGTDWTKHGSFFYIKVFLAVGSIVSLIAVFNFINLCTARAMNRAKEVGVRKVVGAVHRQLIAQFLCETFMMTAFAVLFALFALQLFLPLVNNISGKTLTVFPGNTQFVMIIVPSTVILTLLSGLYPAFYLSAFNPSKALKGYFNASAGRLFRKVLVVTQFTLSVILIIGTIAIYSQLRFMQDKNLGFDKDNLIDIPLKNELSRHARLMKHDLLNESSIGGVTITTSNMIDNSNSTSAIIWEGREGDDKFLLTHMNVDVDFLSTTGVELLTGRNFDNDIAGDSLSAYILNESAAKRMGYTPESAIGKKIKFWDVDGYVIGVVKDFHFKAMTASIDPILLRNWRTPWVSSLLVKARGNRIQDAIGAIENIYKKYESQTAPSYQFLDQALQNQYRLEQNTGRIVLFFSILAVIVSCLGLFGLATHTAIQRTKEVGVRKVLGASVVSIVHLLSVDFLKLVLISIVIATPIGWWSMNEWLKAFAYRISVGSWMFLSAATLVLIIAMITVSFQSFRAAISNPVKTLRTE